MTRKVDGKNESLEKDHQDSCREILQGPYLRVEIRQTRPSRLRIATAVDHFGVAGGLHLAVHGLCSELMRIGAKTLDCATDVKLAYENELDRWDYRERVVVEEEDQNHPGYPSLQGLLLEESLGFAGLSQVALIVDHVIELKWSLWAFLRLRDLSSSLDLQER